MPAGVEAELAPRGAFGGLPAQLRRVDVVLLGDAVEGRAGDAADLAGQAVRGRQRRRGRRPRCASSSPAGVIAAKPGSESGLLMTGERAGRAGRRDPVRLGAAQRPQATSRSPATVRLADVAGAADVEQAAHAADHGRDADRGGDAGLRRAARAWTLPAAQRVAPEREARRRRPRRRARAKASAARKSWRWRAPLDQPARLAVGSRRSAGSRRRGPRSRPRRSARRRRRAPGRARRRGRSP